MVKKLIAFTMSLVLILSIVPMGMLTASAAENELENVKAYLSSLIGTEAKEWGNYQGTQCVELPKYYVEKYFGVSTKTVGLGNGNTMYKHIPSKFPDLFESISYYDGIKLQPGDIVSYHTSDKDSKDAGHAAVVYDVIEGTNQYKIIEQWAGSDTVRSRTCTIAKGEYGVSYTIIGIARPRNLSGSISSITYADITPGVYYIRNIADDSYLNLEGADENAGNVNILDFTGYKSQMFEITESTTTDGYKVRPLSSSSRLLNVYAELSSLASGKNVCIYEDTGDGTQRWLFEESDDGYVIHCVGNQHLVLDAPTDNVCVSSNTGADTQVWELIPVDSDSIAAYKHLFPVQNGKLAYYYGYSASYGGDHTGIDIHTTGDDTIYAACGGTVDRATDPCPHWDWYKTNSSDCGHFNTFGNYIRIKNDDGTYSYYGHLKQGSLLVSTGQRVEKGQAIATMGSSGASTGKHLHYEVRKSDASTKVNTNPVADGGEILYSYTGYNGSGDLTDIYSEITPGVYYIKNVADGGYLNLEYGKDEDAANIHLLEFGDYYSQMFEITESTTTDGYKIRPIPSSSRLINVYAELSSLASGKNVCIYHDTGDGTQRWLFEEYDDGYVIHCVGNTNLVMDAPTWDVCVSTYTGADTQLWELVPVTHTVSYDANGGSGAPSSQTKVYGSNLIISPTIPTREGYAFLGWSKSSTATSAEYKPGDAFSSDDNTILYAVWQSLTASTGIQSQLDKIIAVYPSGSYFTTSGSAHKAGGADCPDVCYECMLQEIPSRGGLPAGSSTNADTIRYQCYAFASYVSYIIFGDANVKNWQTVSVNNAKLGDVVYFSFNHWGIYLYTSGNKVVVYDGNYDYYCGVNYGSEYSISNVSNVYHASNYDSIEHTHSYTSSVTKAPTCATYGIETYTCSCGASYTEIIPATEHLYSEWIIDKEPTCIEQGHKYRVCSSCGGTNSSTIGNLGHSLSWVIDENATCTDDGSKSYHCIRCDYKMNVTVIPATGHSYISTIVPATPSSQGYTTHTCTVCGDSYVDSYVDHVDENTPQIVVDSKSSMAGRSVNVTISLKNNPGIVSATMRVSYDSNVLTLTKVTDAAALGSTSHKPELTDPYTLVWVNDTATTNFTSDGTIVTLTFEIAENAEIGEYPITVSYDYDNYDIYNTNAEKVKFVTVNGCVNVIDVIVGDVNRDGLVNNLDRMILTRYLADWDEYGEDSVDLVASDVNGDGLVNNLDRMVLTRHLADWDGYEDLPYVE